MEDLAHRYQHQILAGSEQAKAARLAKLETLLDCPQVIMIRAFAFVGLGIVRARVSEEHRFFEEDKEGETLLTLPLLAGRQVCDILAFDPENPDRFFTHTGLVPALGINSPNVAFSYGCPLHVLKTPLEMMRTWCRLQMRTETNTAHAVRQKPEPPIGGFHHSDHPMICFLDPDVPVLPIVRRVQDLTFADREYAEQFGARLQKEIKQEINRMTWPRVLLDTDLKTGGNHAAA